ncbi:MAG: LysM peptidoglycan-binding domain-containing protein [Tissierellia bacterium]|nr:LysM peptidoglycan-binding domain-containing protein [Tissierellia bacterium]
MRKEYYSTNRGVKRLMSLLLALVLVIGLYAPVSADEFAAAVEDLTGKLVIVYTNDTHGGEVAIEGVSIGAAGVAQIVKDYEEAGAEVLLVSAGDAIQGDPLVNLSKGKTAIEFMNLIGYDFMVPGNHEFDFGYDNLKELVELAEFPIHSVSVLIENTGLPAFGESVVLETEIGKVGLFGITTPETQTKANPKNVASLKFLADVEMYQAAQKEVGHLEELGADYIISVAHLGIDEGSRPNTSYDLLENVKGIDILIDGHSHSIIEGEVVNGTILTSTGTKYGHVGVIVIDEENIESRLISAEEYNRVDESINAVVNEIAAEIDEELSKVFAVSEVFLDGNRDPGVRTQETNLGNFSADAILWAANEAVGGGVDAAITNGGGIRESIAAGDVTMKDMKTVFPFGNTISTVEITGAQLIEILEASTFSIPQSIGAFPQVSGIEFTLDTSVPYENGEQFPDSTYFAPANPGARIKDVRIGGEAIDLDKVYTVATNDFLAAGGDTYYLLKNLESYNTYVALEDALVNYTEEVLDGVISEEKYGQAAGLITIVGEPVVEEEEVIPEETVVPEVPVTEEPVGPTIPVEPTVQELPQYDAETYTVVKGDSLWKIARKYLGKGARYTEIFELNKDKISNPNYIYPSQVLVMPAR